MKRTDKAATGMATLTPRERDVIGYVAAGKPNKVIALELGISMRTIETHRARIFHKMGVRNAVELVRRVYAPAGAVTELLLLEPVAGLDGEAPRRPDPGQDLSARYARAQD